VYDLPCFGEEGNVTNLVGSFDFLNHLAWLSSQYSMKRRVGSCSVACIIEAGDGSWGAELEILGETPCSHPGTCKGTSLHKVRSIWGLACEFLKSRELSLML